MYTVTIRGIIDGEAKAQNRVVTSVADVVSSTSDYDKYMEYAHLESLRFVISNTTEAGIVYDENDSLEMCPPVSFPGKLTKFLYERFSFYNGDEDKGLIMLPAELIDNNGKELKNCVVKLAELWNLGSEFVAWINNACVFCSTLVDRIVSGYPKDDADKICEESGYTDKLLVAAEPFALWVIESDKDISEEFPLDKANLPYQKVIFTDNLQMYKKRKVRILNGAHTSFVLASFLCGNKTVYESMNDELIRSFMEATINDEIVPMLDMPENELKEYADSVIERFLNPYIKHELLSIALNSVSKWKTRCMPTLVEYSEKYNEVPKHLAFSLAALMQFYAGDNAKDNEDVMKFFKEQSLHNSEIYTENVLSNEKFWGMNLNDIPNMTKTVSKYMEDIRTLGMRETMDKHFM